MRRALLATLLVCGPVSLFAQDQSVTATFTLSADHTTICNPCTTPTDQTPRPVTVTTRYEIRATPPTGAVLVRDLGKPAGANVASVSVPLALPSGNYSSAVVCAIGPGGEGCSTPAPPFTVGFPPTARPRAPGAPTFK